MLEATMKVLEIEIFFEAFSHLTRTLTAHLVERLHCPDPFHLVRRAENLSNATYLAVPTSGCVLPISFLMCNAKFVISSLSKYRRLRNDV